MDEDRIKGSHLLVLLRAAGLYDKKSGRPITVLENKIALVSAMTKEPNLVNYIIKDEPLPLGLIVRLRQSGINICSPSEFSTLQKTLKPKQGSPATFGSGAAVRASLTLRAPLSESEMAVLSRVSANIEVRSPDYDRS